MAPSTVKSWGESQETGKYVACQMLGAGLDCRAGTEKSWQPILSKWRSNFHLLNSACFPAIEYFPTHPVWGSFPFFQRCLLHTVLVILFCCLFGFAVAAALHVQTHAKSQHDGTCKMCSQNQRNSLENTEVWEQQSSPGVKEDLPDPAFRSKAETEAASPRTKDKM